MGGTRATPTGGGNKKNPRAAGGKSIGKPGYVA